MKQNWLNKLMKIFKGIKRSSPRSHKKIRKGRKKRARVSKWYRYPYVPNRYHRIILEPIGSTSLADWIHELKIKNGTHYKTIKKGRKWKIIFKRKKRRRRKRTKE